MAPDGGRLRAGFSACGGDGPVDGGGGHGGRTALVPGAFDGAHGLCLSGLPVLGGTDGTGNSNLVVAIVTAYDSKSKHIVSSAGTHDLFKNLK